MAHAAAFYWKKETNNGSLCAKQKRNFAKNLRSFKDKLYPERGGGKKLAAKLEISPQLLSNWLNGSRTPSLLSLGKLARIFDVSIQELCTLPRIKHRLSAWEIILDLTKLREQSRKKGIPSHIERERLENLNAIINNELVER